MSRPKNNSKNRLEPFNYYSELSEQRIGKILEETENTINIMSDPEPSECNNMVETMSNPSNDSTTENIEPPELLLNIPKSDAVDVVEKHNPEPKPETQMKELNFTPFVVAGGVLILLSLIM